MILDGVVGQPAVNKAHARFVPFGLQRDLDRGRPGRDRMTLLFPAKGEDDLSHRIDLDVLPRRLVLAGDQYAVHATRSWVDLRHRAVPLDGFSGPGHERPARRP